MSEATLYEDIYEDIDKLIDHGAGNKASTIIKVICISTEKDSLETSQKLVDSTEEIIGKISKWNKNIDIAQAEKEFNAVNEHIGKIDSFLSIMNHIFNSGLEIEMDEDSVLNFLSNMQKVQKNLVYISDFFGLAKQVHNELKSPKNKSSIADLVILIKAA
jgi:hypothetical protein